MTKVHLTHIGSLPYTDFDQALDFTFQFDIPVLFTLPKLDPTQQMHAQFVLPMQIGQIGEKTIILDEKKFLYSSDIFIPHYWNEFSKSLENKHIKKFKFQLMGPVSFIKLVGDLDSLNITKQQIFERLSQIYANTLQVLSSNYDVLFFLDEPMFNTASHEDINLFNKLVNNLNSLTRVEIGMHVCSKVESSTLNLVKIAIKNLDMNLYSSEELQLFTGLNSWGTVNLSKITHHYGMSQYVGSGELYITPSCGLAFDLIEDLSLVFSNLSSIKRYLLEQNTQLA